MLIESIYKNINDLLYIIDNDYLECELISYKISGNNVYMTIKHKEYQFNCIFWNGSKIITKNEYKDGDNIKLYGKFTITKKNFSIYYNIKSITKVGNDTGDYLTLYNNSRQKIIDFGLNLNKKILFNIPYNIGIITSLDGAALQDILETFKQDKLIGNIYIKNATVQGKTCVLTVIKGIDYFEEIQHINKLDVLLITRGGGSFDDLIGFSDWNLIERIHKCSILTFSAIGHQIDNQLSDEVCDYKFPTPSIAAKYIIEQQKYHINKFNEIKKYIYTFIKLYNEVKIYYNNIHKNIDKIIYQYDIQNYYKKINKLSTFVNNSLKEYYDIRKLFLEKISNLKPVLFKNKEVVSIYDFIDKNTNDEITSKKLDIKMMDGEIKIYYKIINYKVY